MNGKQIEFAPAESYDRSNQANRSEGTVHAVRLRSGPTNFRLLRDGADKQFIPADFQNAQRACAWRRGLCGLHRE
jgi:hypothetical protein